MNKGRGGGLKRGAKRRGLNRGFAGFIGVCDDSMLPYYARKMKETIFPKTSCTY